MVVDSTENIYSVAQQEFKILAEMWVNRFENHVMFSMLSFFYSSKMIQSENISGLYVIPSYESSFCKYSSMHWLLNWIATITTCFDLIFQYGSVWYLSVMAQWQTVYSDSTYRCRKHFQPQTRLRWVSLVHFCFVCRPSITKVTKLHLKFPYVRRQTVIFQSELVHPLICPYTGLFNISDAFPTWNSSENHLWQLLKYIQFIFEHPMSCLNDDRSNAANSEASELIRDNKIDEFKEKCKECVRISKDKVYDPPPTDDKHYITFNLFDEDVHKGVLESIRNQTDVSSISPPPTGLSWVKPGEFKPLSKWLSIFDRLAEKSNQFYMKCKWF